MRVGTHVEYFREWTRVNSFVEDELEDDEEAKAHKNQSITVFPT